MKRWTGAALATAFLVAWAPATVSAQVSASVIAGPTFPISDYGDFAEVGWMGFAGVRFAVGEGGFGIGAEGFFGSNSHEAEGDKTNLYGGHAMVGYGFGTGGSLTPFVFGGAGLMVHAYKSDSFPDSEGSDNLFSVMGGAGVGFPLGGIEGSVDGWIMNGFGENADTRLFGTTFGLSFPLGGGDM